MERNSTLARMFHKEVDGSFKKDILDVAFAIADSVRLVHGLGNEGTGTIRRKS
jgi:hypothetical protein